MTPYGKMTFPRLAGDRPDTLGKWWQRLWEHIGPHSAIVNYLNSLHEWQYDDGLGGVDYLGSRRTYVRIETTETRLQWPTARAVIDWCLHHRHAKKVLVINWSRDTASPDDLPAAVTSLDYRDRNWESGLKSAVLTKFDFIVTVTNMDAARQTRFISELQLWTQVEIIIETSNGFRDWNYLVVG